MRIDSFFHSLSLSLSFIVLFSIRSWIRIENRQLFESRIIYRESTAVHPIISIIRIFSISKPIDLVRASPTALLDFATSPPPPPPRDISLAYPRTCKFVATARRAEMEGNTRKIQTLPCHLRDYSSGRNRNKLETYTFLLNEGFFL